MTMRISHLKGDFESYKVMCDDKLTCYEPEAKGHLLPLGGRNPTVGLEGLNSANETVGSRGETFGIKEMVRNVEK